MKSFNSTKHGHFPENNRDIEWLASSGELVQGRYSSRLWFVGEMYVYYQPEFWRYIEHKPETVVVTKNWK